MAVFFVLMIGTSSLSAVAVDQGKIPAGTQWLIHVDMQLFNGTYLKSLLMEKEDFELNEAHNEVLKEANIDIFSDVTGVSLFGKKEVGNNADMVVMVSGNVDSASLIAKMKEKKEINSSKYGKYNLYILGKSGGYLTFTGNEMLLYSRSDAQIKQVLDVIDGKKKSMAGGQLASYLQMIPSNAFLLAVADNVSSFKDFQHEGGALLQKTGMATFMAMENNQNLSMKVLLNTDSEETAQQIESIVRGLVALVSMKQQEEPELAKLIQALKITREGTTINLNMTYPSDKIVEFISSNHGKADKHGKAKHKHHKK